MYSVVLKVSLSPNHYFFKCAYYHGGGHKQNLNTALTTCAVDHNVSGVQ